MADFFGMGRPGGGLDIRTITVRLTAHAAIAKGDVVAVADEVSTSNEDTIPHFYKTKNISSGDASVDDNEFGILAVALESVASGEKGLFALSGIVQALVSGTPAVGVGVSGKVTTNDLVAPTAGDKVVAFMLEEGSNGAELDWVMFDGVSGFGQKLA